MPMLLMFSLGRRNYGFLANFEFIAEEIVHTLVGSLGLVTPSRSPWRLLLCSLSGQIPSKSRSPILGPEGSGDAHIH